MRVIYSNLLARDKSQTTSSYLSVCSIYVTALRGENLTVTVRYSEKVKKLSKHLPPSVSLFLFPYGKKKKISNKFERSNRHRNINLSEREKFIKNFKNPDAIKIYSKKKKISNDFSNMINTR